MFINRLVQGLLKRRSGDAAKACGRERVMSDDLERRLLREEFPWASFTDRFTR
jgi:hypothetical protein